MQAIQPTPSAFRTGTFIRVRGDHADWTRAGKDGLVVSVSESDLGLIFGTDRNNRDQGTRSVGIEAWDVSELDLASAEY